MYEMLFHIAEEEEVMSGLGSHSKKIIVLELYLMA